MQSLSKAMAGDACTVKWMFGVPELLRYLRANHIEEGSAMQPLDVENLTAVFFILRTPK